MRKFALIAAIAALAACGQAASGGGDAAAQGAVSANAQRDFVSACVERYVAQNAQAQQWAPDQCEQDWQLVVSAGPIAEAILAAEPVSGTVDPNTLRTTLTSIQWNARPEGTLIAQGRLGDAHVQVDRNGPSLNFMWGATGAMIPYDVVGALTVRGANVEMIGCSQLGVGEAAKVYRVAAPGKAPFQLSIYDRMAPTANAESFYNASASLNGQVQTIAQLRHDGSDWSATCAM